MLKLAVKSVSEPAAPEDGLRILATRFRGHRLPKSRYDVWMANLGPSDVLLEQFKSGEITWPQFKAAYRREVLQGEGYEEPNKKLRNSGQKFTLRLLHRMAEDTPITLLCHCGPQEQHCHRHVLKELIEAADG